MPRVKRRIRGPGVHIPILSPDDTVYRFSAKAPTHRLGSKKRRAGFKHKQSKKKAGYRIPSQRPHADRDNRTYVFRNDHQDFPLQTDTPLTTPEGPHQGEGHPDFPSVDSMTQSEMDDMAFGNNASVTPDMLAGIPEIEPSGELVASEPPAKPTKKASSTKGRRPTVERQTFVSSHSDNNLAANSYSFANDGMSPYGSQATAGGLGPMKMLTAPMAPASGSEQYAQPMANLPVALEANGGGLPTNTPVTSANTPPAPAANTNQGWVRPGYPGITGIPGLGGAAGSSNQPSNTAISPGDGKAIPTSNPGLAADASVPPMGMTGNAMSPMGMMGSGMSPMGMMGSGMSPMGMMGSGMSPMGMTGSGMSPMGMTGSGMSPMGMTGSGMSPMGMTGSGMSPMGMMGSGMSPMGVMGSGMSPRGMMGSGMSPMGMMGSGMSPMGMMGSGMSPMGMMGSGMSPMGVMGSGTSPMGMMGRSMGYGGYSASNAVSPFSGSGGGRR